MLAVKNAIMQVLSALDYLHRNGIVHRDVKLENLLIQEPGFKVKIADFGLSTIILNPEEKLHGFFGSVAFMAPEILRKDGYRFEVDIWASGVVLYALLANSLPFPGLTREEMLL